ncbi:MAG: TIGR03435 family protein [Acidobacteriota bacterium]|nr:TIGR03435 family protein [Acidobacteriota bacterium]
MTNRRIGVFLLAAGFVSFAQEKAASEFAAASIHPSDAGNQGCQYFWPDAVTFRAINATVTCLMRYAWDIEEFQIRKSPRNDIGRYDIMAKSGAPISDPADRRQLVASLLTDRFHLRTHRETRQLPTYRLVIAGTGPHLTTAPCLYGVSAAPGVTNGKGADMQALSRVLSTHLGRSVQNATGLRGCFDFLMRWTPWDANAAPDAPPDLLTAIQEQLGLKLEASRGPVPLVVIDRVEPPSAN